MGGQVFRRGVDIPRVGPAHYDFFHFHRIVAHIDVGLRYVPFGENAVEVGDCRLQGHVVGDAAQTAVAEGDVPVGRDGIVAGRGRNGIGAHGHFHPAAVDGQVGYPDALGAKMDAGVFKACKFQGRGHIKGGIGSPEPEISAVEPSRRDDDLAAEQRHEGYFQGGLAGAHSHPRSLEPEGIGRKVKRERKAQLFDRNLHLAGLIDGVQYFRYGKVLYGRKIEQEYDKGRQADQTQQQPHQYFEKSFQDSCEFDCGHNKPSQ